MNLGTEEFEYVFFHEIYTVLSLKFIFCKLIQESHPSACHHFPAPSRCSAVCARDSPLYSFGLPSNQEGLDILQCSSLPFLQNKENDAPIFNES